MYYETKPFRIQAVQWLDTEASLNEIKGAFGDIKFNTTFSGTKVYDYLQTTWVDVNYGDYIIRGMKGEYYPCAEDVFETKYKEVA